MKLYQIRHNAKSEERQKTSFPKKSVENTDFYKPVLNKIMTRHEKYVKSSFVAPLKSLFLRINCQ